MNRCETVCIIGSGPSGLTSCKSALECGLEPTVFEKKETFGGVWSLDEAIPWDSMHTNVSHFSMTFSDFQHPEDQDLFLSPKKVHQYLSNYANHFGLLNCIKFGSTVEKVKQLENNKWLVQWTDSSSKKSESKIFDFLIVGNGMNNKPRQFPMEPLKNFTGGYRYSNQYKSPNEYIGKRVLVVGKSCTGLQIASELCNSGCQSVYLYGEGKLNEWAIPSNSKRIKNILKGNGNEIDENDNGVPVDLIICLRANSYKMKDLPENEYNLAMNKFLQQLSGNNCNEPSYQNDETNFDKPFQILFTCIDSYIDNIKQGKIQCLSNHLLNNSNDKSLEFLNQLDQSIINIEFDEIIFATGYHLNFSFFEKEILEKLSFNPNDNYVPCLLYNFTFPHKVKNLGLVGIFGTPFYSLLELQSRWINYVFSGLIDLPSEKEMGQDIIKINEIRNAKMKTLFPFGDYVLFSDQLAKQINCLPDFDEMKLNNPELYDMCLNYVSCSSVFRLTGPFSNEKQALNTIKHFSECCKKINN
ncbi:hypothetical protein DDB_G0289779 [Dictyostelium discoideum AX4]|uniref:Flavin-containing monooxygenase n=1 Tax=Dictyostelium discoideum TaxID=44689 RepID=Q54H02_DICDI|nr:hypothetical protein DDB_G0289779 [Dictyostelium discoideum AX4]EAL62601.1 hypothetical protein DDB_G0289779 [Dictyostelium discoideum AX4]|eukprot:XP_636116.1 hypothetical protein DDB_G0289779 [Dictyostelium discoideum AX4]